MACARAQGVVAARVQSGVWQSPLERAVVLSGSAVALSAVAAVWPLASRFILLRHKHRAATARFLGNHAAAGEFFKIL